MLPIVEAWEVEVVVRAWLVVVVNGAWVVMVVWEVADMRCGMMEVKYCVGSVLVKGGVWVMVLVVVDLVVVVVDRAGEVVRVVNGWVVMAETETWVVVGVVGVCDGVSAWLVVVVVGILVVVMVV